MSYVIHTSFLVLYLLIIFKLYHIFLRFTSIIFVNFLHTWHKHCDSTIYCRAALGLEGEYYNHLNGKTYEKRTGGASPCSFIICSYIVLSLLYRAFYFSSPPGRHGETVHRGVKEILPWAVSWFGSVKGTVTLAAPSAKAVYPAGSAQRMLRFGVLQKTLDSLGSGQLLQSLLAHVAALVAVQHIKVTGIYATVRLHYKLRRTFSHHAALFRRASLHHHQDIVKLPYA